MDEDSCYALPHSAWDSVSAGGYHTCGITKQDETSKNYLKCWGLVDDGQIGWVDGKNVLLSHGSKTFAPQFVLLLVSQAIYVYLCL